MGNDLLKLSSFSGQEVRLQIWLNDALAVVLCHTLSRKVSRN